MKIIAKILIVILSLSFMAVTFSACNPESLDVESGIFVYRPMSRNDKNNIAVVGLIGEGLELETVEIPTHIDGKKVVQLGYEIYIMGQENPVFNSEKLKKIILPYTLIRIYEGALWHE